MGREVTVGGREGGGGGRGLRWNRNRRWQLTRKCVWSI